MDTSNSDLPTIGSDSTAPDQSDHVMDSIRFGRYRIQRELGRGGMGVVLLAIDEELGLPVALKMLPPTVGACAEAIAGLKAEVLRGIALTHPGIVRVHQFERDETGAGIVMEYVTGETLADRKMQEPSQCFDGDQIRPWLEQLAAALDYAHNEAQIAHRDLKPRNLMITREGRLKIADFGLASALSESLSRISTRADSSGTPPYMSPQQAMGKMVTRADDIYAMGATIYELLTSKPPFFRGDILAQVIHATPPAMSERRMELGIVDKMPIPPSWENAIAACLSKEPAERPRSMAAFLGMLDDVIAVETPTPIVRVRRRVAPPAQEIPSKTTQGAIPSERPAKTSSPVNSAPIAPAPVPSTTRFQSVRTTAAPRSSSLIRNLILTMLAAFLTAGALHLVRLRSAATPARDEGSSPAPAARANSNLGASNLQPARSFSPGARK